MSLNLVSPVSCHSSVPVFFSSPSPPPPPPPPAFLPHLTSSSSSYMSGWCLVSALCSGISFFFLGLSSTDYGGGGGEGKEKEGTGGEKGISASIEEEKLSLSILWMVTGICGLLLSFYLWISAGQIFVAEKNLDVKFYNSEDSSSFSCNNNSGDHDNNNSNYDSYYTPSHEAEETYDGRIKTADKDDKEREENTQKSKLSIHNKCTSNIVVHSEHICINNNNNNNRNNSNNLFSSSSSIFPLCNDSLMWKNKHKKKTLSPSLQDGRFFSSPTPPLFFPCHNAIPHSSSFIVISSDRHIQDEVYTTEGGEEEKQNTAKRKAEDEIKVNEPNDTFSMRRNSDCRFKQNDERNNDASCPYEKNINNSNSSSSDMYNNNIYNNSNNNNNNNSSNNNNNNWHSTYKIISPRLREEDVSANTQVVSRVYPQLDCHYDIPSVTMNSASSPPPPAPPPVPAYFVSSLDSFFLPFSGGGGKSPNPSIRTLSPPLPTPAFSSLFCHIPQSHHCCVSSPPSFSSFSSPYVNPPLEGGEGVDITAARGLHRENSLEEDAVNNLISNRYFNLRDRGRKWLFVCVCSAAGVFSAFAQMALKIAFKLDELHWASLTAITSVEVLVLSFCFILCFKTKCTAGAISSFCLIFAGVALFFFEGKTTNFLAIFSALIATLFFSFSLLTIRLLAAGGMSVCTSSVIRMISEGSLGGVLMITLLIKDEVKLPAGVCSPLVWASILAAIFQAASTFCINKALTKRYSGGSIALRDMIECVVMLLLQFLFLRRLPAFTSSLGIFFVLCGCFFMAFAKERAHVHPCTAGMADDPRNFRVDAGEPFLCAKEEKKNDFDFAQKLYNQG